MPEEEEIADAVAVEAEKEEGNGNGSMSLFGFEAEPFDPLVTTFVGHRVAHMFENIEDRDKHDRLMVDLIEHVWAAAQVD
jgi:hypothetical protein